MRRVAYLAGPSFRGVANAPGTTHPMDVENLALLRAAGAEQGLAFDVVFWDEATLPQQGYDLAVIRTCWDYHERPAAFIATLEAHECAGLPVLNAPDVVRWNSRKTYLKELGPSAIETVWAERADAAAVTQAFDALGADDIVVKPQVGGGSVETIRLQRGAWHEADLAHGPRGPAMIQAYLKAIETEGELSLIWFGGQYSHCVRKVPQSGDWLANQPGKTRFIAETAPRAAIEAAEAARAHAPQGLLYVRIDLVLGDDGAWRVIEIEAIEPHLFLDLGADAPRLFAGAIARVLG
ncbi:RimK family alpha-L-glutamate ligase [Terricaulis sp.]|uniref:RimK family alpha-L-glutamate ligase n=1 Tax=Terricaulis sp. TaxID=2768686 RepID=UPI0037845F28